MQTTKYFRNSETKKACFTNAGQRINLDMKTCKGYTGELEKLKYNYSELTSKIN